AGDGKRAPSANDIATLRRGRGLARNDVDPVYRDHRQNVFAGVVAYLHLVLVTNPARDVALPVCGIDRQDLPAAAAIDGDVGQSPNGECAASQAKCKKPHNRSQASHALLPTNEDKRLCKRSTARNGVRQKRDKDEKRPSTSNSGRSARR